MEILGVPVDEVTRETALMRIATLFEDGGPHIITTPNPEMVVDAQRDPAFMAALRKSSLAIPDGAGLVIASRFMGEPIAERVTGTDMVDDIAGLCAERGLRVYLLGGDDGVAERAAAVLRERHPGLEVAGAESGGRVLRTDGAHPEVASEVMDRVRAAAPDVLFVAFGHGTQEKWIASHLASFPGVRIAMGIGGAFDFIVGRSRRAPGLFRMTGLEWLWRLVTEPWRWRRIVKAVFVFPYLVLMRRR